MRRDLPVEWVDALLVALCELPPDASAEQAATALVEAAAEHLTDAAIGVCVTVGDEGQRVIRRSPRSDAVESPDPTRLFPEYAFERIVAIGADDGSTLHLASDDEARFSSVGAIDAYIDRIALALGAAIRNARLLRTMNEREAAVKELEAQVIQAGKLASLGQIAAGIVHELNNPLTSIVAYSDYLHKKALRAGSDAADIERLARINEAAERILRFSRDLMAYSRPTTSVPAPVAIHDVLERALVFCDHVLGEMHVQVEREFGEVRLVRGVAGQLTQVFVNLFTNAAHAMRDLGGRLIVKTALSQSGDSVCITVRDEGHGIDAAHLERIFEPFFTTKTDGTGSGLGLSIVRNIVASHGGKISAHAHPERGTVFELELPLAASPSDPPAEP